MIDRAPDDIFALFSRFDLDGDDYRVFTRLGIEPSQSATTENLLEPVEALPETTRAEWTINAAEEIGGGSEREGMAPIPLQANAPGDRLGLQNLFRHVGSRQPNPRTTPDSLACRSVTIRGFAGGVGATTIAAVLARFLARSNRRCAILENAEESILPVLFGAQRIVEGHAEWCRFCGQNVRCLQADSGFRSASVTSNCVVHYLYAIPRLIFVSAPLVYLLLGKSNLYGYLWEIVAYATPHLVLSNMVNSRSQGDHRHSFWNEVYEMVLAPYILLPTTFALINPKWGKFNVTAKSSMVEESFFDWKIARPYLFLIGLNLIGMIVAILRYFTTSGPTDVLVVNVVWALLNTLMLGAFSERVSPKCERAHVRGAGWFVVCDCI